MTNFKLKSLTAGLLAAGALTLVACGGGGGSSVSSGGSGDTASSVTLTGVAATGAAFTDGVITVTDASGKVVGTSTAVGADGAFSIALSSGAVAPFILTATRTNAEGATESLVSVVPPGAGKSVNISPVTTLIAARLSTSGDPLKLASEVASGSSSASASAVAGKVTEVKTMLATILAATGTTDSDPLTTKFATDGTGYDRLLDSIRITITPATATSTNIEVGLKVQQASETNQPPIAQFNSSATTPPPAPAVSASSLLPSGTSALIQQHLAQLNACYALPVSTRVPSGTSAASIAASECKSVFYHNDPSTFLSNGSVVGLNKAFNGIFQTSATGLTFSQGAYEFSRGNGDIVVSYKAVDTSGNQTLDTFVLRKDETDGKLKQIGNQYVYSGGISAYQQLREYLLNSADAFLSTGYDLKIPLINSPTVISHVDVTAPDGTTFQLLRGSDGMVFPKPDGSASGTSFVRLSSEYVSAAGTEATDAIKAIETGLAYAPTPFSESKILSIPNQSVWTFKYYSGATGVGNGTLQATQTYKTRARAATIGELRTQVWANLDDATIANIKLGITGTGYSAYATLPPTANVTPTWVVPKGALPPASIKLFGKSRYYLNGGNSPIVTSAPVTVGGITYSSIYTGFNDNQNVGTTTRSSAIACADGGRDANNYGERHCNAGAPGYLSTARATGVHLWARDPVGREYAHYYATYALH